MKTLGLDLGTNSIGWAVVTTSEIIGTGVRVFPEGVNRDTKGAELSKNETRRLARGSRKQTFRRKIRKRLLLSALVRNGMAPLSIDELDQWKKTRIFPDSEALRNWFMLDPYELRIKALKQSITLMELGRVFYHISRRRGFKSNRKQTSKEDGIVTKSINSLQEKINESGHTTLGAYLASQNPHKDRIRNRFTDRSMYIHEFNLIWKEQSKYHQSLTQDLKEHLGISDDEKKLGLVFFQLPLKSQKYLIGRCTFEPKKHRCSASAMPFELFRAYQFAHSIEFDGQKLSREEREAVVEKLKTVDSTRFSVLKKILNKEDSGSKYADDQKVMGCYTHNKLSKLFGKEWDSWPEQKREEIWHTIFSANDADWLHEHAKTKWLLSESQLGRLSKIQFSQEYANLSRKAINNILPFLKDHPYHVAVVLGGIRNVFGSDWEALDDKKKDFLVSNIPDIISTKSKGGFIDDIRALLIKEFALNEKGLSKLYHHSQKTIKEETMNQLPIGSPQSDRDINALRNPIVIQTMFELRKLINALIKEYGPFDKIKLEMARDLKNSLSERERIRLRNSRNENQRSQVKSELEKLNPPQRPNHDNILKYMLWQECQRTCPYTGKPISVAQLYSGEVQIEHIVPWSRSLDDSYLNKTLCFADENRKKGDQTPFEFYGHDEQNWTSIKERALSLFHTSNEFPNRYHKFKRFATEKQPELDDFVKRQLNDTRFISKEARNILLKVCKDVQVAPGQMTAHLRHHWGLNKILNSNENVKSRMDHRHHAIDALVIACHERRHLQQLSKWNRYDRRAAQPEIERPWEGFWMDAKQAISEILVSHRKRHKVISKKKYSIRKDGVVRVNLGVAARGKLHEATVYGKHNDKFHSRKPLAVLTPAEIPKIVDDGIWRLITNRLKEAGIVIPGRLEKPIVKESDQKKSFKQAMAAPMFLSNRNGDPIPVKKVRIRKLIGKAEPLKSKTNQYVDPKNNHHVVIYRDEEGKLHEQVVNFWTAVERKMQAQDLFQLPPPKEGLPVPVEIVSILQINDSFLLGLKEEEIDWDNPDRELLTHHLYRVQKLSSKDYNFRLHTEATLENSSKPHLLRIQSFEKGKAGWSNHNPIKVRITLLGKMKKMQ